MEKKVHRISMDEYHSLPYHSFSLLKNYEENPDIVSFRHSEKENQFYHFDFEESQSKTFGSIIHLKLAEPEKFGESESQYMAMLKPKEREMFGYIMKGIEKNKLVKRILADSEFSECSFFNKWGGHDSLPMIKIRPDIITKKGYMIDIKTTRLSLSNWNIRKVIDQYRYDMQLALYEDVLKYNDIPIKKSLLLFIEKVPPFDNHLYAISNDLYYRGASSDLYPFRGWKPILREFVSKRRKRFTEEITTID